jgi:hypothetical protein
MSIERRFQAFARDARASARFSERFRFKRVATCAGFLFLIFAFGRGQNRSYRDITL